MILSSSRKDERERNAPSFEPFGAPERPPVDAHVVALAKHDPHLAFETLYGAYRGRIFTFLLRLSGSGAQADDLTQETFEKAFKAMARLAVDQKLLPWLYRIANNTAIDHLRRRNRYAFLPWAVTRGTPHEEQTVDEIGDLPVRAEIGEILRGMPADNASALLLHALEGYSYEEIAGIQGCTLAAARSRIARARAAFKERYPTE